MLKLGVNIDHIATLRQARLESFPDPIKAARMCEISGADSIVCHLRKDRRHIQDKDLLRLRKSVKTKLNLEMSTDDEIVKIALRVRPDQATLVPEKRQELTTEGGLDVVKYKKNISRVVEKLQCKGIIVSLFIDPKNNQIKASQEVGAEYIELHTGTYANATGASKNRELRRIKQACTYAHKIDLGVNAGHGLDYINVGPIARIPVIEELNIGFSIVAASVFVGLGEAIRQMKQAMVHMDKLRAKRANL
ncbi:MAG: pyridoxine 5'-phosphate synthase [Candidatus Omnitrophica bacterium]|nr:pyridoxine 5'-phosphate synthase [Candidatus Omnitrophota bacterium]